MEKQRPQVGVAVIVVKESKILLGKRKNAHGEGNWSPAGGYLEFGESVEDCARRELSEEMGIEALSLELGPWTADVIDQKHYLTFFVFVREFKGEPKLLEPNRCEGWHWFCLDDLPNPLFPTVRSLIEKIGIAKLKGNSLDLYEGTP